MTEYKPDVGMLALYKAEIWDRQKEIDPSDEHDWESIALGWALAKGMTPDDALRFASYVNRGGRWP